VTAINRITLLIDLLTIIEVDRVLQVNMNAMVVLELKQLFKGKN
jgi:hypothetical protein